MAKSKRLWSDVCILVDDNSDTESEEYPGGRGGDEEDTITAGFNNDDTEVGTNTLASSTVAASATPAPISSVVKGRGGAAPTWEGVSVLADDADTLDSVPPPAAPGANSPQPGANSKAAAILLDTTPIATTSSKQ
jgi:hypothetical protein